MLQKGQENAIPENSLALPEEMIRLELLYAAALKAGYGRKPEDLEASSASYSTASAMHFSSLVLNG